MTSSIYPITLNPFSAPNSATDILQDDIAITAAMVSPGGGATLRLMFAFELAVTPAVVTVFNGTIKGILNPDNSSNIILDGYYRFDIDVESGDTINLQASENITSIRFIRAHLVQFGT